MTGQLLDRRTLPIFIHSAIDDMTWLSPNAMRVYMHLARRAGSDNRAWPSYQTIGDHCFASAYANADVRKRHAIAAIKELVAAELIRKEERVEETGQLTNLYVLCDVRPREGVIPQSPPSDSTVTPPVTLQSPKGTPIEGIVGNAERCSPSDVVQETLLVVEKKEKPPQPKDHPAVQAYRALHNRYPRRDQMVLIAKANPDLDTWNRAMELSSRRGYRPDNIDVLLEWVANPYLMERRPSAKAKNEEVGRIEWSDFFDETERINDA